MAPKLECEYEIMYDLWNGVIPMTLNDH